MVTYSKTKTKAEAATAAVSQSVTLSNTRYGDRLTLRGAFGTSIRRQTRGSRRCLGRLGPTRSVVHSARLFAAPDHSGSRWSRRVLESVHAQYFRFFRIGRLFRFVNSQLKMRSGESLKVDI